MIPSNRRLTLRLEYPIGATVLLRCRPESLAGLVSGLIVRPHGIAYIVAWGDATESNHFGFELQADPDAESDATDPPPTDDPS